jgi:hypothetical protein
MQLIASMFNREMVKLGLARWYRKYTPNDTELAKVGS